MDTIGPGTAVRITDHSAQPRDLLRALDTPLRQLRDAQQLPVVHLRRGWLHGSHLRVLVRSYPHRPPVLEEFTEQAGRAAAALTAQPPTESDYLRRAEQLGRWENRREDPLPLHPHGHVESGPDEDAARFSAPLLLTRDLMADAYLDSVLDTAALPDEDLLPQLARILALVARSHPQGYPVGTLALRSHVEGVCSATGNHTDLRAIYARRYRQDAERFTEALTRPVDSALLAGWEKALTRIWGTAEAACAHGTLNEDAIHQAVGPMEYPLGRPVRSEFIAAYLENRQAAEQNYRQNAYRLLLNTLYPTLTCFGITPMQRYYLCYGIAEAADELTGATSVERMRARRSQLAAS
ncbi:hypothetical protein [Kitasatospora terrestris]|uniref:Thiopeptide-type bacteriocin biosynthesis domain-containing protein n=1 Tax=Kitasatospora terrestris TaxID=258051 RepID=A0ABP9DBX5_9ACTN